MTDKDIVEDAMQAAIEAAGRAISADGFGADWPHSMRTAQAAITAYLTAMREAGFVVVPVEPTPEMVEAYWTGLDDYYPTDENIPKTYRAMIAARPDA